jgi:toxin ParE1/3/4
MGQIIRAPRARIDLWEIADYIAQDNVAAAVRFLDEVNATLEKLSQFPGMGPEREDIAAGLRSFPIGSYVLYYRRIPDGIEIARVLHGRRDANAAFRS